MIVYGIGILPLIRILKEIHITCIQPWFADDAGAAGTFESIAMFFDDLLRIGPDFGYFPEPSKSIFIARPLEKLSAEIFFNTMRKHGFQITTGHRYLGGFIGDQVSRDEWLSECLSDWESGVLDLTAVASNFPQTAYAGLQKSLQHEWGFLQRVLPGIGDQFKSIEESIRDFFVPALFGESTFNEDDYRRNLTALPVKFSDLSIPNPT